MTRNFLRKGLEVLLVVSLGFMASNVEAGENARAMVDKVVQKESKGNPRAYNKHSGARGLMQITPVVLKEWNQYHPKQKYSKKDLFNAKINRKIGTWYLNRIEDVYLRNEGLAGSRDNIAAAYNFGIGNLADVGDATANFSKLPEETRDYIQAVR